MHREWDRADGGRLAPSRCPRDRSQWVRSRRRSPCLPRRVAAGHRSARSTLVERRCGRSGSGARTAPVSRHCGVAGGHGRRPQGSTRCSVLGRSATRHRRSRDHPSVTLCWHSKSRVLVSPSARFFLSCFGQAFVKLRVSENLASRYLFPSLAHIFPHSSIRCMQFIQPIVNSYMAYIQQYN